MFNILRKAIRSFKKDQSGVTAIEYGLIAIIMAAFIIFAFYKNIVPAMEGKMAGLTNTINAVSLDSSINTSNLSTAAKSTTIPEPTA